MHYATMKYHFEKCYILYEPISTDGKDNILRTDVISMLSKGWVAGGVHYKVPRGTFSGSNRIVRYLYCDSDYID